MNRAALPVLGVIATATLWLSWMRRQARTAAA
jgi:hypothetical protein